MLITRVPDSVITRKINISVVIFKWNPLHPTYYIDNLVQLSHHPPNFCTSPSLEFRRHSQFYHFNIFIASNAGPTSAIASVYSRISLSLSLSLCPFSLLISSFFFKITLAFKNKKYNQISPFVVMADIKKSKKK